MSKKINLLRMIRVHIVFGGLLAFLLGSLLGFASGGRINPLQMLIFYGIVFFGDLSTHFSNDFYDFEHDKKAISTKIFAGKRVLISHPEMRPLAITTAIIMLIASIILASLAVMILKAPIELLIIALFANVLGWIYSAPPVRLVARGLGELAIAVAAGFAIPAVGYISVTSRLDAGYVVFAAPFLLYGLILAFSLQVPDIGCDRLSDKINLGVRRGEKTVFLSMFGASLVAFAIFGVFAWVMQQSVINLWWVTLFSLVPLGATSYGLIESFKGKDTVSLSAINILSLFAINVLIISYLSAALFF